MPNRDYISPRQLAEAIGVSESSLKRWSDQGLLPVTKTAGGHRRLTVNGVVHFLRTTKTPIINPRKLGLDYLELPDSFATSDIGGLLSAVLLNGDPRSAISTVVTPFLDGRTAADVCDHVIWPAMVAVGSAWERGDIDVYREHRATRIAQMAVGELRRLVGETSAGGRIAVGAAPCGDPYSLASAMAELVLTELGWNATDLGPNTPVPSLLRAASELNAQLVWLSVTSRSDEREFALKLDRLGRECQRNGRIVIVGGQAVTESLKHDVESVDFGACMADLVKRARAPVAEQISAAADVIGL